LIDFDPRDFKKIDLGISEEYG